MAQPYNILSLDGGGSWALIQVLTLQQLFGKNARGSDVLRGFDLVVANSGGSIVASALFLDLPLDEILALFEDRKRRDKLFVPVFLPFHWLTKWAGIGPRYKAARKLEGLRSIYADYTRTPNITLSEVAAENAGRNAGKRTDLVIVTYNYDRDRAQFLRSNAASHGASFGPLIDVTLAEAVHASTNAPVNFFDAPAIVKLEGNDVAFWDGGVTGFNNPVMVGVLEARAGQQENVRVLSLGTGNVFLPLRQRSPKREDDCLVTPPTEPGLVADLKKLATSILSDPPDSASFIAHLVLGGRVPTNRADIVGDGPVVRMNPLIQPVLGTGGEWLFPRAVRGPDCEWGAMPKGAAKALDEKAFSQLVKLDMDAMKTDEIACIENFAQQWFLDHVPNQPIRVGRMLECEIGHRWFSDARRQALDFVTISTAPRQAVA